MFNTSTTSLPFISSRRSLLEIPKFPDAIIHPNSLGCGGTICVEREQR